MNEKILVVDDEKEIADLVEVCLRNEGYSVCKFYNGTDALEYAESGGVSLGILDVMLPDIDGFTLVQRLRERFVFPIIMLTAKVEDTDKITGLMLGADDYMTKPFSPPELVARVKTQLRRFTRYNSGELNDSGESRKPQTEIDVRGLNINSECHRCTLNGKEIVLTPIEFSILWYLCSHRGSVVSGEELFEAVWGEKYLDSSNTVMAHIARLREKLGEPPRRPRYIKTVWGVGYTVD